MKIQKDSTREEIFEFIVETLRDDFGIDESKLLPDANLRTDLDIDSIDIVDLIVKVNKISGKRLAPEAFESVRTIQDATEAVFKLMQNK